MTSRLIAKPRRRARGRHAVDRNRPRPVLRRPDGAGRRRPARSARPAGWCGRRERSGQVHPAPAALSGRARSRERWERTYAEQQREVAELRAAAAIDTGRIAPTRDPQAAGTADADALTAFGLFRRHEIGSPVRSLSVGQQRRLAPAILLARSPELDLLDEPTNHISLALAVELEEALGMSRATVVVASHDLWFRRAVGRPGVRDVTGTAAVSRRRSTRRSTDRV